MKILCPFVIISFLRIWVRYYRRARKSRAVPGFFLLKGNCRLLLFDVELENAALFLCAYELMSEPFQQRRDIGL